MTREYARLHVSIALGKYAFSFHLKARSRYGSTVSVSERVCRRCFERTLCIKVYDPARLWSIQYRLGTWQTLTDDTILVSVESIYVQILYLTHSFSGIIGCNLLCTLIVLRLCCFLRREVRTVEIIRLFGVDTISFQYDTTLSMLNPWLCDISRSPECSEIEIIVKGLDTECDEDENPDSYDKSSLNDLEPPEYCEKYEESYHE